LKKTRMLFADIIGSFEHDLDVDEKTLALLLDMKAGLASGNTGDDGRRRYENINLKTTYSRHRERALQKRTIEYHEIIAANLASLVEATVKVELAAFEIEQLTMLRERLASDKSMGWKEGIYAETRMVIQKLFEIHSITRWHFANATDQQIEKIARILWRQDEEVLP
jgi:hypothetical protein